MQTRGAAAPDPTATAYTDSSGRALEDYKRPSVAVDTALLTVAADDDHLSVLLVRRMPEPGAPAEAEAWALPGTFLHEGETLIDAVRRSLREKAGIEGVNPRQLHVFDDPCRDSRGWVLSVAHLDVVPTTRLAERDPERTRLARLADAVERLPFEHDKIIAAAAAEVRAQYARVPDPYGLLPEPFTILDLRLLHEAVAGEPLQRDTFRRQMISQLTPTGEVTAGTRGRPAELFRRVPVAIPWLPPTATWMPTTTSTQPVASDATNDAQPELRRDMAAGPHPS